MDEDILAILAIFLCVFTPIAGLTLRFALKPLVDSIARLMEARAAGPQPVAPSTALTDRRFDLLESELGLIRQELQQLSERREFMDQLSIGR